MRRLLLVMTLGVALAAPVLLAHGAVGQGAARAGQGQGAAQGQAATPPQATALILGQVVDGSTGRPIADAVVTLTSGSGGLGNPFANLVGGGASPQAQQAMQAAVAAAQAGGRGGAGGPQSVMTGADGRFVFHDLPPGQYRVSASLAGYMSNLSPVQSGGAGLAAIAGLMSAGGSSADGPTAITLKEGEIAAGMRLRLWKHAVVSGTVLDDVGQPAIGVQVQAVRRVMTAGRARYVPSGSARTDDRGVYRISGLTPGQYLAVIPQTQIAVPAAIVSGLIDAATSGNAGGMGWAALDLVSSGIPLDAVSNGSGGVRIGDYLVASSGLAPVVSSDGHLIAAQTIFYPGVPAPTQASVVALASGEERADLNFQLRMIPTYRISGVATGPDGPVANLGIRLVVPGDGIVSDSDLDVASAISRADGTFAFFGVPPGQFQLRAVKQPRPTLPAEVMAMPQVAAMFGGAPAGSNETLFIQQPIAVGGSDIDGLALSLAPGYRVSGRLEFQSASGKPAPTAAQLQGIGVTLSSQTEASPLNLLGGLLGGDRANAQGEFRTKGYAPGKYSLTVTPVGGWQVKSATMGGRDVLDAPIEIATGDLSGIVVTLTDRVAQVSGMVSAPGETDVSEMSVILFPSNYRAWVANGMSARLLKTARASRAGAYTMADVPAGEYLVAAVDRASVGDLQDPAFIEALARVASRLTVGSEPVTFDVTKSQVTIK